MNEKPESTLKTPHCVIRIVPDAAGEKMIGVQVCTKCLESKWAPKELRDWLKQLKCDPRSYSAGICVTHYQATMQARGLD